METVNLREYMLPLRRWWWLVLASTLVAGLASFVVVRMQPIEYRSHATLMVGGSIRDPNPNSGEFYLAQQLVTTYVDLAQRDSVRQPTMAALGLEWLPAYSVRQVPNTQLMELGVVDTDPVRAQLVGQALIDQLVRLSPAGGEEQTRARFVEQQLDELQTAIVETKEEVNRRQTDLAQMFSARQIADSQAQIGALENKLTTLQSNFTSLLATTQKGAVNTLTIIEPPSPSSPVDRGLLTQTLLAAAIGFLLAAGGAYLIEYLDNTFRNSDEVQQKLGLTTVGAVPSTAGEQKGNELVMVTDTQGTTAEAFRILRTNLQFTAVARPLVRLLVTSSLPAEGKSFVCANLAVAMAQTGRRVILVDCDLHRPRQHKVFGLVNNMGLTSALLAADLMEPERFLQPSPVPKLRVLTTGPLPPNPAELLGSQRMRDVLDSLQKQADLVLIDSPPVSVLADSAILSSHTDGVLMVLHAGKTSRDVVKRSLAALQQVHAHVIGVVLNRMPLRGGGYYYYHHYNYSYSKKYYRRTDTLAAESAPVPVAPAHNGNLLPKPKPSLVARSQGNTGREAERT